MSFCVAKDGRAVEGNTYHEIAGMSQDCILDMIEARLRVRLKSMLESKE